MHLKRALFCLLLSVMGSQVFSQTVKPDKYPSLLWEISGNGMKKSSYLFGTMHVSSKLAFNLSDSFYIGIRNADVVALETNPESWQEDMSRYDLSQSDYMGMMGGGGGNGFNDYLRRSTLSFEKYEKSVREMLSGSPSVINNLLYRSYGDRSSDFEEDTYLDMHIYQCGKKWGKRVAGVESYAESMRLMMEAYKDASKEKNNRKVRSYDYDEAFSATKLQDAYRTGNLDLLDTINKVNSQSEAFDEKFLYRRNEIQADNIDSILRTNASLFVGVGAAHLPGQRGVIELLRRKGYTLRPVKMGARNSDFKASVEKIRVPVTFSTQFAADSFYRVDVPGKLYEAENNRDDNFRQYADMANGSYYVVIRMPYSPWLWGHSPEIVQQKIDSMLYENIPGRILERSSGRINGYRHIDVTNKTRRGDVQRYRIFITPFELVFFKMSGNADYVQKGTEADRFFNSIQFRNFKSGNNWVQYTPASGGFTATFPHTPHVRFGDTWFFDAEDSATQTNYRVMRMNIHNLNFVGEDTFDLGLMDESFATSKFIASQVERKQFIYQGYPALDVQYRDIQGGVLKTRYLIKGPHYYVLMARGKSDNPRLQQFLESFQVRAWSYGPSTERVDTSLYYRVQSPVFPEQNKEKLELINALKNYGREEGESEENQLEEGMSRAKAIVSDSTGEKILVIFSKTQRYYYTADSSRLEEEYDLSKDLDSSWIVRFKYQEKLKTGMKVIEVHLSDSGSSRMLRRKAFIGSGVTFVLSAETDTLQASSFIRNFFDTFQPADTLKGFNPFEKKGKYFFEDFFSADSLRRNRALKKADEVKLFEEDIPNIRRAIISLNWKDKKYLDTKKSFISALGSINTKTATDYLVELYAAAGDTLALQQAVLTAMVDQQTSYSYKKFRDILVADPPVLMEDNSGGFVAPYLGFNFRRSLSKYARFSAGLPRRYFQNLSGNFLSDVTDSMQLAKAILPDLLPLLNLDDYETPVMSILGEMVDSNMVKAKDYKEYVPKFLLKARQEVKRQSIQDQQKAIRQVEQGRDDTEVEATGLAARLNVDDGNEKLELYSTLLLPYWDKNAQVPKFFDQMLRSPNSRVRYATLLKLIRTGKPYPDTLVKQFANDDLYAYELYKDLRDLGKETTVFPAASFNKVKLATSRLIMNNITEIPDSISFITQLPMKIRGLETEVYFFRYRVKKDDFGWKLAIVGPMMKDSLHFIEYSPEKFDYDWTDFTELTGTKLKNESEEPLLTQIQKELRKLEYSLRKSAAFFYDRSDIDMGYFHSVTPEDD
jgi:uncharacterized protein YbaP (TraB family)